MKRFIPFLLVVIFGMSIAMSGCTSEPLPTPPTTEEIMFLLDKALIDTFEQDFFEISYTNINRVYVFKPEDIFKLGLDSTYSTERKGTIDFKIMDDGVNPTAHFISKTGTSVDEEMYYFDGYCYTKENIDRSSSKLTAKKTNFYTQKIKDKYLQKLLGDGTDLQGLDELNVSAEKTDTHEYKIFFDPAEFVKFIDKNNVEGLAGAEFSNIDYTIQLDKSSGLLSSLSIRTAFKKSYYYAIITTIEVLAVGSDVAIVIPDSIRDFVESSKRPWDRFL